MTHPTTKTRLPLPTAIIGLLALASTLASVTTALADTVDKYEVRWGTYCIYTLVDDSGHRWKGQFCPTGSQCKFDTKSVILPDLDNPGEFLVLRPITSWCEDEPVDWV